MRYRLFFIFALMVLCCSSVARAEHNGIELSENCAIAVRPSDQTGSDNQLDALNRGLCIGLVRGVLESMQLWDAVDSKHTQQAAHGCVPFGVMPLEAIKVVIKYLNDHPEKLHEADTILVFSALSNAYPCSASPPRVKK